VNIDGNINQLRTFSNVLSPASFRKVLSQNDPRMILKVVRKYRDDTSAQSVRDALQEIYSLLLSHYRNEYVYKNTLLNKLLNSYGLESTIVFDEFKIAGSIADFVFLNGEARIYEIKTALDDFSKLEKQLADYRKFAHKVYLVTSPEHQYKALEILHNTNAGIIILAPDQSLMEIREAGLNIDSLSHEALFNTLRKPEYTRLIFEQYGYVPVVPNTRIYKACLELARKMDICLLQQKTINILKERKLAQPELLQSSSTPYELKQICYVLNLNKTQYNYLYALLNKTI